MIETFRKSPCPILRFLDQYSEEDGLTALEVAIDVRLRERSPPRVESFGNDVSFPIVLVFV